jgi:hypothetical protein
MVTNLNIKTPTSESKYNLSKRSATRTGTVVRMWAVAYFLLIAEIWVKVLRTSPNTFRVRTWNGTSPISTLPSDAPCHLRKLGNKALIAYSVDSEIMTVMITIFTTF